MLEVHLQGAFAYTPVRVSLDSKVVFDSLATTNLILGLAERIPIHATQGAHMLEVIVEGEHIHREQIVLDAELYVAVIYNAALDDPIAFQISQVGFVYF